MTADELLDELARRIARAVVAEMRAPSASTALPATWIDQSDSPLGARLHCRAVRRRRAEGKSGAAVNNRRHLLSAEALREEMERSSKPPSNVTLLVDRRRGVSKR